MKVVYLVESRDAGVEWREGMVPVATGEGRVWGVLEDSGGWELYWW